MTANTFEATFRDRVITTAKRGFGVSVTLERDGVSTASFKARRHGLEYEVIGAELGFPTKIVGRDYLLLASDVTFGGGEIEPQEGDRIVEGTEIFEIMPLNNKPAAELKPGGFEWLVHTKKVT